MITKPGIFLTICFIIIAASCRKDDSGGLLVIDTHASEVSTHNLSEVFTEIDLIRLETTPLLINIIRKVVKTNEFLFVADINSGAGGFRILQFDVQGNFIKQIGNIGHGPEEYIYYFDSAVDTIHKQIFVVGISKIICYDFDGAFVLSMPFNVKEAGSFPDQAIVVNNQLWLFQSRNNPLVHVSELIRFDNQLNVMDTTSILHSERSTGSGNLNVLYCMSDLGDKQYLYYPVWGPEPLLRDTLYELRNLKKTPVLKFDFSDILKTNTSIVLPDRIFSDAEIDAYFEVRNMRLSNVYRTDRYVFAEYSTNRLSEDFLFCYDLDQEKRYNMKDGFTDDLFGTGIAEIKPLDLQHGLFYFVKNGYEVEETIDGVNEGSNPVIFIIKTKE